MSHEAAGPPFLEGVQVLDMTEMVSGPYCTAVLSDFGADVVKIERIGGDPMRRRQLTSASRATVAAELLHRNKRSIVIDVDDPRGIEVVRLLAATVDVFVENFRPGSLDRRGLGAPDLMAANPGLVYCSISGFGRTGPLQHEKAVDLVAQGHAGLLSVTGHGDRPAKAGFQFADTGAALWAALGVLAALRRREVTGTGSHIDVSLTDSLVAFGLWEIAEWQSTGMLPQPQGTIHRYAAPYETMSCGDGRLLTVAVAGKNWRPFVAALGRDDLVDDPRFESDATRHENRAELRRLVEASLATGSADAWIDRLRRAGVPCGVVNTIPDVLGDEQFRSRRMFPRLTTSDEGLQYVNSPVKADGVTGVQRPAPEAGGDSRSVLRSAGYGEADIDELISAGVVECSRAESSCQGSPWKW